MYVFHILPVRPYAEGGMVGDVGGFVALRAVFIFSIHVWCPVSDPQSLHVCASSSLPNYGFGRRLPNRSNLGARIFLTHADGSFMSSRSAHMPMAGLFSNSRGGLASTDSCLLPIRCFITRIFLP